MLLPLILAAATAAPVDYRQHANWLCRPGRGDACGAAPPARVPKADCFYVYPTVSLDPGPNSDLVPGVEERGTVAAQLAPLGDVCRLYAPLYRQVTLAGLRSLFTGAPAAIDRELPYADVLAAWRDYLARDNRGRPFVLVGHSQGANALRRLIAEEIDGKPISRRMLSAILPGSTIDVPAGRDVGGTFKALPLCRSTGQTGCILSWASFRESAPPPANTLFGRSDKAGMTAACTNPAAPGGGSAPLDAILGAPWWRGRVAQYRPPTDWPGDGHSVRVAGALSGRCITDGARSWLSVRVDPHASAAAAAATAAATIGDDTYPEWGWHVVDMAVVEGDLVRLIAAQTAAWRARK